MVEVDRRIMAVVLTHNAPASLARCLEAVAGQTCPPDAVLVVDNASRPPVEAVPGSTGMPPVRVVRSEINTGPAGGYSRALAEFLGSGFGHAWVLDDDMCPGARLPRAPVVRGPDAPGQGLRLPQVPAAGRLARRVAVVVRLRGVP